ncbi:lysosomal-trafficking regulator-like isoform X2 [Mya arenaria]|uniref:lysosomal-trafficking regulator-like isoform X2 n=1 Tax=Mya arenaria TaxID=6604 RepID=UPI0022E3D639|nr:lysosomal-trafficking regulator-like isoform X2 [Mya arenaria]
MEECRVVPHEHRTDSVSVSSMKESEPSPDLSSGSQLTPASSIEGAMPAKTPRLKEVWEVYIQAVKSQDKSASNVEKQAALLNILLRLCAHEMKHGTLTNFGEMQSVCNQLCREFMTDILHITSRCETDDTTQLQNYLLNDRGWLLLQVLHRKGAQHLSGSRDLANLLVSLLPWCLKFPLRNAPEQEIDLSEHTSLPPISACFQNVLSNNSSKNSQTENQSVPADRKSSHSSQSTDRNSMEISSGKKRMSKRKLQEQDSKDADYETEEEISEEKEEKVRKLRKKFRYCPVSSRADRQTQNQVDSDSDDDDIGNLLKIMNIDEENVTTGFHLCLLILSILRELCVCDLTENENGKFISPSSLPELLQCLIILDDMDETEGHAEWEKEAKCVLKMHLVRVVLLCCGIVSSHQNGLNILKGHRVIEQVFNSALSIECLRDNTALENVLKNHSNEMKLMSDCSQGLLLCLTLIFNNLPFNPSFTKTALYLVEEYDDQKGFQMLEKCVLYKDWLKSQSHDISLKDNWLEEDPIKVLGMFLSTLKVVRVNYVHSMKCVKRKHQKCSYSKYFDHHHDILGAATGSQVSDLEHLTLTSRKPSLSSQTSFQSQSSHQVICLVSSCTQYLLDLLIKVNAKVTQLDILRTVYSSGICCCMSLESVISVFVKGLEKFTPAVRTYCADTMNRIILEQFSGKAMLMSCEGHQVICSFCEDCSYQEHLDKHRSKYLYRETAACLDRALDSGIDSSDINSDIKLSALYKISKWRPISNLKSLLFSDNEALATSVAKHLLVLAIKGNPFLKAELFFGLYIFAMEASAKRETTPSGDSVGHVLSRSVQIHCLSALPFLLQANCVTKVFLSKKGVRKLCELLEDDVLRAPVLRIFEALVIIDEYQFRDSQLALQSDCPCPYKGGRVIDAFISELSKLSFSDAEMYVDDSETPLKSRIRRDSVVLSKFSLVVLVDLWSTCAKLCLHSNVFVAQFKKSQSPSKTEGLLIETLDIIMSPDLIGQLKSHGSIEAEDSGMEGDTTGDVEKDQQANFSMRVALLESLMAVIGAVARTSEVDYPYMMVWHKVKERFSQPLRLQSTKLKTILDAFLTAAMPQYKPLLEYSFSKNIALVYTGDDDIYDEDEVRHLLQSGSDEDASVQTDLGYDADSEDTHVGDSEKERRLQCLARCGGQQRMYFPGNMSMLTDCLLLLHRGCDWEGVVSSVLNRLLQCVQMDSQLAKTLCQQNVLSAILAPDGFWNCLLSSDTEASLQEVLLALIEQLGQHNLESHDLQRILQLFQHSDLPMEKLLPIFLTIVQKAEVKSQHSVTFPARAQATKKDPHEDLLESSAQEAIMLSPLIKTMKNVFLIATPHADGAGEVSSLEQEVWSQCAIKCNLHESLSWPPFQTGFTLALWLCVDNKGYTHCGSRVPLYDLDIGGLKMCGSEVKVSSEHMSGCVHVISMGTREKLLEIWTETFSGSLIFRLTSECSDMGLVVKESKMSGVISPGKWQHVVISYIEELDGSTLTGKVNMVLDGWQSHSFILDHPFAAIRSRHKSTQLPPFLLLGHTVPDRLTAGLGNWNLGQLLLFKGSDVSKELCFHLYTLGPNIQSILKCDMNQDDALFSPYLTKNVVVHSGIQVDTLVGHRSHSLNKLRQALLYSYDPRKSTGMAEYQVMQKPTQLPSNSLYAPDDLLTQQAKVITPVCQGHLRNNSCTDLEKAIEESGGMAAILFLVAKVFERCPESMPFDEAQQVQSLALKVLLTTVHHSSRLQGRYTSIGGHELLVKILTSSRSVPGVQTLKVLMDAATTESIFKCQPNSTQLALKHKTDTVIRDISIIEHLVLDWHIWERCLPGVIELLFAGIAMLVVEEHPYHAYNIKQYHAINIVGKIFKIYQERIQEGFPALPIAVSQSVITIVQNLSGSPPDFHLIQEICHFLLLVHPAANTYISHSRSAFYMCLPWAQAVSPLTKLRMGPGSFGPFQGSPGAFSSPVKISLASGDNEMQKEQVIKKNLSDNFIQEVQGSGLRYPDLEISYRAASPKIKNPKKSDSTSIMDPLTSGIQMKDSKPGKETTEGSDKADQGDEKETQNDNSSVAVLEMDKLGATKNKTSIIKAENIQQTFDQDKTNNAALTVDPDIEKDDTEEEDSENTKLVSRNLKIDSEKLRLDSKKLKLETDKLEIHNVASAESLKLSPLIPENFESLYKRNESGEDENNVSIVLEEGDDDGEEDVNEALADQGDDSPEESGYSEDTASRDNLSLNFDEENTEIVRQEEGLIALCVELLRHLGSLIQIMPDVLVEKTFHRSLINGPVFIVLAQNSSAEIRQSVIQVIAAYLHRCSPAEQESFMKHEGFHLLSAQMYQYPTHTAQLEAAMSVVLHRIFNIDDGLHPEETLDDLSRVQQAAIPLVLALLGNSTGDLALCHNSLQCCCALFERSEVVALVMMEQGLIEVLCSMLVKLLKSGSRCTDVEGADESDILFEDLQIFFRILALREFSASGDEHYRQFEDIIYLLQDIENTEALLNGVESRGTRMVRHVQYVILVAILELVERASEEASQTFSIFTKSTSAPRLTSSISTNYGSRPIVPPHRTLTSSPHNFSVSGSFGKFPFRKRSSGYYVKTDAPFGMENLGTSGSGAESDSSQDSLHSGSVHKVNVPVRKHGYGRTLSLEMSLGKSPKSSSLLQTMFSHIKRKKHELKPLNQNELIERLKRIIALTVETAVYTERKVKEMRHIIHLLEPMSPAESAEWNFMRRLITFTYRALEATLTQEKSFGGKKAKNLIMWGAKDVLRVQLGRLVSLMLSNRVGLDQRVFTLSFLTGEQRGMEILNLIIQYQDLGNDLGYHIHDLIRNCRANLSGQQIEDGSRLINHLTSARCEVFSPRAELTSVERERIQERKRQIEERLENQRKTWTERKKMALEKRIYKKFDDLASHLRDGAMEMTQTVTQLQTSLRNGFITHIKQNKTASIQVKKQWQEIVQNLTHERALWYDEKSYPKSWQLDPTEGPCRVRKRLQRGHLGILPKFIKKQFQYKLASETVDPPLIYLFEDDHQVSDSAALIYQIHRNKKIRFTSTCRAVSPVGESKGELLIGEDSVFFVADEAISDANYTQVLLGNKDQLSMTWPFEDILEVQKRWYELTDTGIEIFLTNGKTCLLALRSSRERDELFQRLLMLELPNRRSPMNIMDALDSWENRSSTNFEYLTELNKLAGRSFNDLMQYPIMPFILKDYTSPSIDLRDISVYRDLSKPVSVQDPKNEQKFKMNYEILKGEFDRFGQEGMTGLRVAPYHYGSHYSNSGSVLHFLVRLPPFTKMFLGFQDQSFDIPDRTFHNMHTSWRLSSAESNTDVKELIPEFFFFHEFLINSEEFDFGSRQNGEAVNNVVLPPWCGNNARLFTLIHRQALESEHVMEHICGWIDLVLGYKQTGDAAVRAVNVFHPATYFGLDVSSVKNTLDRKAIQTMVRTYGQTPKQLFKLPHPRPKVDLNRLQRQKEGFKMKTVQVAGLKWGTYLGSPDCPEPVSTWDQIYDSPVGSLIALPGTPGDVVFGISPQSCLLVQQSQDKNGVVSETKTDVTWAAILTWSRQDGLVRIIKDSSRAAINCIMYNQSDEISCCVSVADCRHLFIGGSSGVISAYRTRHNKARESELQVFGHPRCLYGHTDRVTSLVVCRPYSVLVSCSQDGTCIIWDLNRLSYVRSIRSHKSAVKALAISNTLGDIASVSSQGMGSQLVLHTINAEEVAMVTCEDTINCLAYSGAPEGTSINVVAGGLSSGLIRLWSSWDLTPVRDLCHKQLSGEIISLTFTTDSQKLYASSTDGRVMLWENTGQSRPRNRFRPYLFPDT